MSSRIFLSEEISLSMKKKNSRDFTFPWFSAIWSCLFPHLIIFYSVVDIVYKNNCRGSGGCFLPLEHLPIAGTEGLSLNPETAESGLGFHLDGTQAALRLIPISKAWPLGLSTDHLVVICLLIPQRLEESQFCSLTVFDC